MGLKILFILINQGNMKLTWKSWLLPGLMGSCNCSKRPLQSHECGTSGYIRTDSAMIIVRTGNICRMRGVSNAWRLKWSSSTSFNCSISVSTLSLTVSIETGREFETELTAEASRSTLSISLTQESTSRVFIRRHLMGWAIFVTPVGVGRKSNFRRVEHCSPLSSSLVVSSESSPLLVTCPEAEGVCIPLIGLDSKKQFLLLTPQLGTPSALAAIRF